MATAQVIFQRFYFSKSFVNHDFEVNLLVTSLHEARSMLSFLST